MDAIVFDWDGTLVDTLPAMLGANAQVLSEYGLPFDEDRYRSVYTPDWRAMYLRLGVPESTIPAAGARWLELYSAILTLEPFAGAEAALRRLSAVGHVMGIVTAGDRAVVERQLERFGLSELLPVRVCGDDDIAAKPHPAPLLRALEQLGALERAEHATYVGDAPDDMRLARAVGARGIGIVSILGTAEELVAAGAAEVHPSVAAWVDAFLGPDPEGSASTPPVGRSTMGASTGAASNRG
ncbi:MAG TPA: HAD family hydrolase [Candidatus Eisenbacteria bacterium]|nr:HAD family hydrolase [Candidatus Eisenbacteria bacterium]